MTNPLINDDEAPKHIGAHDEFSVDAGLLRSTIRNCHQVTSYLFRGGQPDAEGFEALAEAGVKTVLCLRTGEKMLEAERKAVEGLGMKFISMPIQYWRFPPVDMTAKFLEVADNERNWPLFVHCAHGMDRTGLLMAMFRITRLGWSIDEAYREMKRYGFRRFKLRHFKWTLYEYARTLLHTPAPEAASGAGRPLDKDKLSNVLVVYNANAGTAKHAEERLERIQEFLKDELGCSVTMSDVGEPRHELNLDESKFDLVVAIGGDGTVAGVLERVYKSARKVPVAVVPTGTSNLLARSLGVYPQPVHRSLLRYAWNLYFGSKRSDGVIEAALRTIKHGQPIELDLAQVNDKIMVTSVNVGPMADATAAPDASKKKRLGMFAYVAEMLKQSRDSYRKFLIRVDDEDPFEANAMGILVSNLPNFGIGTPEDLHEAQDGMLDLFVVDCESPRQYWRAFWLYARWIISNNRIPPYLFRRVKRVRATTMVDSTTPDLKQATIAVDGDFAASGTLDIRILPRAVTVLVPPWVAAELNMDLTSAIMNQSEFRTSDAA